MVMNGLHSRRITAASQHDAGHKGGHQLYRRANEQRKVVDIAATMDMTDPRRRESARAAG
jgi:hypothetical protein